MRKRHTTSKSGASGRSKKRGTSPAGRNSSQTSAPSFALDGTPPDPEKARWLRLRQACIARIAALLTKPEPRQALLRDRHKQKLAYERRYLRQIDEMIDGGKD